MRRISTVMILFAASAAFLGAQADPPGRVGRLNYINGPVSFQPAGVTDWVDASINRPLTTGDNVWVGDGGKAEIHVGSTGLRLDSNTAFQFLNLDDRAAQIRLSEGTLTVRVRNLTQGQNFEVDTPSLAFALLRPGVYRISADPNSQTTTVTVRDGDGEVTGGGQTFPVHAGQQAIVTGGDQITYNLVSAPGADAWDQWSASRDRLEDQSQSARYVSREVPGYEDLDQNGRWQSEPGYGQVWMPTTVAAGWAPYHDGHWAWVAPWGWTWVDDAPWGFAPYHYGRWARFHDNWGWVPGPLGVTPIYAPALVGWIGGGRGGAGFSLGFSIGNAAAIGWFPLGPREPYFPSYQASQGYFTRVNNTNTVINNTTINNYYNDSRNSNNTTITNIKYVNQQVPNAVIAVPQNTFASGRPVAQNARAVTASELASARVARAPAIAPQQVSVLGPRAGTASSAPRPPANVLSRPVVARTAPPPAPVPFARQQSALAQNPGRPLAPAAVQQMRQSAPAPSAPVHVVNMSQVRRVQPTVGAGPQGSRQANATPSVTGRPNPQQAPNVPAPVANTRPNTPPASGTARSGGGWSTPVAKPGAPQPNVSAGKNVPPARVEQQHPSAPPASVANTRPNAPPSSSTARPSAGWSTPVAKPGGPQPNAHAGQNVPPARTEQRPSTPPAAAANTRPSAPPVNRAEQPNSRSSTVVAKPVAPPANVEQRPNAPPARAADNRPSAPPFNRTAQPNSRPSTVVAKPAAPPAIERHPSTPPPAATNRPSAPPPARQQPQQPARPQAERAPKTAAPQHPAQQQHAEKPQEVKPAREEKR